MGAGLFAGSFRVKTCVRTDVGTGFGSCVGSGVRICICIGVFDVTGFGVGTGEWVDVHPGDIGGVEVGV